MGRKPIVMEMIQETRKREMTFSKRKFGVMKKACELSVLCGCDVALLVLKDDKVYQCGSLPVDEILAKYVTHKVIEENKTSKDIMETRSSTGQSGDDDDNEEEIKKSQAEQQKEEYQAIDREFRETLEKIQLQGLTDEQHTEEQFSAGSEELRHTATAPSLDTPSFPFSPISLDPAMDLMADLLELSPRPNATSPISVSTSQRMSFESAVDSSIGSVTSFVSSMASPEMVSTPELASPGPCTSLSLTEPGDLCQDSSVFAFPDLSFMGSPEKRPFEDEMCGSPPKRQRNTLEWQHNGHPSMGTACNARQDMTSYGQNGVMSPPAQQQMFTPQQHPSEEMPLPMLCKLAYSLLGKMQNEILGRKQQQLPFQSVFLGLIPAMPTAEVDQLQSL